MRGATDNISVAGYDLLDQRRTGGKKKTNKARGENANLPEEGKWREIIPKSKRVLT